MESEIRHDPDYMGGYQRLYIENGLEWEGELLYLWDSEEFAWRLEHVDVHRNFRGRGLAARLFKNFCDIVGRDQRVFGHISHQRSRQFLKSQGYEDRALSEGGVVIDDLEIVAQIPIVKKLDLGGINVTQITIEHYDYPDPELDPDPIGVRWDGFTR